MFSAMAHKPSGWAPATVTASAALGVIDFMSRNGVDPDELLFRVGLRRDEVSRTDNRILLSQFCELFEDAAEMGGGPDIGLEFGCGFKPESLGFVGYLAVSAPTLGHGLRHFSQYLPFHQQATMASLERYRGNRIAFTYAITDSSIRYRRQDAELSIAVMVNMLRSALGPNWQPDEIHFAHPMGQAGRRQHERRFGGDVFFEQSTNRIIFDEALLETAMPRRDPILFELIRSEFEKMQSSAGHDDDIATIRHQVGRLLAEAHCTLPDLAKTCGVPTWTLKRRLAKSGLSFQTLVADVRRALAIEYLVDYSMSVTDTALALGYSEVSAFSRAFRQWTGTSARDYVLKNSMAVHPARG